MEFHVTWRGGIGAVKEQLPANGSDVHFHGIPWNSMELGEAGSELSKSSYRPVHLT